MAKENNNLTEWIESQKKSHDGLPCDLQPILRADSIDGYRNKCEFTIGKKDRFSPTYKHTRFSQLLLIFICILSDLGKSETTGIVTIGFRLSSYAAGCTAVGPIDDLKHIPQRMIDAVKACAVISTCSYCSIRIDVLRYRYRCWRGLFENLIWPFLIL